jgi:hypothetical protein
MRTSSESLLDRYRLGYAVGLAASVVIVLRNLEEVCIDLGRFMNFHLL